MTYAARVVRATGRELRNVVRADTAVHEALRDRVVAIAVITLVVDLVCAGLALAFERHVPQSDVLSYGSALFWCTTQLLTVSSQIHNPVSFWGRVLDVFMEAYALIVVSTLAGSVGAFLIRRAHEREREAERAAGKSPTAPSGGPT
jgi:hypothetical protein